MKRTLFVCDRCGTESYDGCDPFTTIPTNSIFLGTPTKLDIAWNTVDLCEVCAHSLEKWWSRG